MNIYEIEQEILSLIDPETGEVKDFDALEAKERECGALNSEIKRLQCETIQQEIDKTKLHEQLEDERKLSHDKDNVIKGLCERLGNAQKQLEAAVEDINECYENGICSTCKKAIYNGGCCPEDGCINDYEWRGAGKERNNG